MNKTLALVALLGLVAAPAFATQAPAAHPAPAQAVKAEKVVVKDSKEEAKKDGEEKAVDAKKDGEGKTVEAKKAEEKK